MYAHPHLLVQLASEHRRDLCGKSARVSAGRRPYRPRLRAQVGWSLVSLGLRLALPPVRGH